MLSEHVAHGVPVPDGTRPLTARTDGAGGMKKVDAQGSSKFFRYEPTSQMIGFLMLQSKNHHAVVREGDDLKLMWNWMKCPFPPNTTRHVSCS